jgi:hypothetical protein
MTGSPDLLSLHGLLDSPDYPTPNSDVVALMVFEHQMHMMNLLTRAGWESRMPSPHLSDIADEVVDYLLFVDEWPLTTRVAGNSGFAGKFSAGGPRDSRGRSLRQLDLEHRLMRYPCSYMIYSPAFDGLPAQLKKAIYKRMWQVLSGGENDARYRRLSASDRRAVIEILRDTKPEVRESFGGDAASDDHLYQ